MLNIQEVYEFINSLAPFETAEEWDNSGVLVNTGRPCSKILTALDITPKTVQEAEALGCELIVSHHPVIFTPLKSISSESPVYKLVKHEISAICAHTNLDKAQSGVCMALAKKLELLNIRQMQPYGVVGELPRELSASGLAEYCSKRLSANVRISEGQGINVKTVAVIGGSGADFISEAAFHKAQCLITGDAGHHDALFAAESGILLAAAGHFETECPVVPHLAALLQEKFPHTEIYISKQTSPFTYKAFESN